MHRRSLFEPDASQEVLDRLARLTPDHRARWGRMTVGQMLCHVIDYFDIALGGREATPVGGPAVQLVLRLVLLNWPFAYPKNARTLPDLQRTDPSEFEQDRARLCERIRAFATRRGQEAWPPNPVVGAISGAQWGRLSYRHTDHHLRQFGV